MEDAKISNENVEEVSVVEYEVIESQEVEGQEILDIQLSEEEAKQLTQDIQSTTTALYVLLKKAHDTRAWLSLGYKSWTEYIENEFDFSRARSYQLINQAKVIEEINAASGVPLYITEREARDIKKRLPEITERLKEDVKDAGLSDEEAKEKVREILDDDGGSNNEDDKKNIDNAANFNGNDDGWDDPDSFQEKEKDNVDYSNSHNLSDEDRFYYENLLVTLQIFDSMPNAAILGEKIKKSGQEKEKLIKLAEDSIDWINQLLNHVK